MRYKLRKGVVLFQVCESEFIFPSRSSGISLPMIITISEELSSVLKGHKTAEDLNEEVKYKIQRLIKLGYIEEC